MLSLRHDDELATVGLGRPTAMMAGMVLAAGRSTRMGRLKPLLPWEQHTVIEQVVTTLLTAPLTELLVVTGHEHDALAAVLQPYPLRIVFNPDYTAGEMVSSIQAGLRALGPTVEAVLLAVGDQPRIQASTVAAVIAAWRRGPPQRIVIPSYQMRRGHPICLPRAVWPAVLALGWQDSLRSLWQSLAGQIEHVTLDTPTILSDMDTPEDYQRELSAPSAITPPASRFAGAEKIQREGEASATDGYDLS